MHASADLHIVPEMSANLWTVKLLISEILQKRMSKKSLLPYKSPQQRGDKAVLQESREFHSRLQSVLQNKRH